MKWRSHKDIQRTLNRNTVISKCICLASSLRLRIPMRINILEVDAPISSVYGVSNIPTICSILVLKVVILGTSGRFFISISWIVTVSASHCIKTIGTLIIVTITCIGTWRFLDTIILDPPILRQISRISLWKWLRMISLRLAHIKWGNL